MNAMEFGSHIHSVKQSGQEFTGQCPSHEDRKASLRWRDGEKGVVVKCFAGCTAEAITGALGLTTSALFPTNGHLPSAPPAQRKEIARYVYTDESGRLLYETVRYEPKDFRARQPDGKGGWIGSINKPHVRRVLYRLPSLQGKPEVYYVEGERDVDSLVSLGIVATTSLGGADTWDDAWVEQLVAAGVEQVVILPDNDPPGEAHAAKVANACHSAGLQVKVARLNGLPEKGEVSDWLDAGQTAEELCLLAHATPPFKGTLFTVKGDVYHCEWPHLGVSVSFDQLSNHSTGLHAEITVTQASRHLHWARLNLSSSTVRAGLAKLLETRTKAHAIDWHDLLETACVKTAHAFRTPAPIVDLATIEPSTEVRYAVRPLIHLYATNILYGDGGSAKSLLALAMALAVKGGLQSDQDKPLLPHPITPILHGPVLYLDYETCEEEQASQLRRLSFDHCDARSPSIHYLPAHRPFTEDVSHIKAAIQRLGVVLLVVDSMAPACGGRPEEAETVLNFMNALRSLGPSVTRLVVAHVSKADGDRTRGRIFGSVFARNLARSCWEVRVADEEDGDVLTIGLYHEKVNRGRLQKPFGLQLAFTDSRITITNQDLMAYPSLAVSAPLKERVRHLMGTGVTSEPEMSRLLEVKPARIKHAMEQIKRACGFGREQK